MSYVQQVVCASGQTAQPGFNPRLCIPRSSWLMLITYLSGHIQRYADMWVRYQRALWGFLLCVDSKSSPFYIFTIRPTLTRSLSLSLCIYLSNPIQSNLTQPNPTEPNLTNFILSYPILSYQYPTLSLYLSTIIYHYLPIYIYISLSRSIHPITTGCCLSILSVYLSLLAVVNTCNNLLVNFTAKRQLARWSVFIHERFKFASWHLP